MSKDIVEFINKIFESREKAHIFHFQINSHETHITMEAYYTDILELLDKFVETYQGKYGIVKNYDLIVSDNKETDVIKYFENMALFIEKERYEYVSQKDSYLHNIIDEMLALVYKTLFKLKYLK